MNKSKFKSFGFSTKQTFTKMVLAFCFAFVFIGLGEMNAQQATDADILNFTAYPAGTFEVESAFLTLNSEMDSMTKGQSVTAEYRYYWLVAVDIKRNNISVEEALLNNLGKISDEFNTNSSALESLYQDTVDKL